MTAPLTNTAFPEVETFLDEARELASEDHLVLSETLEMMRSDPEYSDTNIFWWKRDENWRDTPGAFFRANRSHYLQRAHEKYAEGVRV